MNNLFNCLFLGFYFTTPLSKTTFILSLYRLVVVVRKGLQGHPLLVRHKQDWGRGFILLLPQAAVLPGSDAGSDGVESASGFVI